MKRIYSILSALILAAMLLVGAISILDTDETYSASENRKLKTLPRPSLAALVDGSFFSDFGDYFADTFPGREALMDANRRLNGFYYFGGIREEGKASLILDFQTNGADQGEALVVDDPETETKNETSTEPSIESNTESNTEVTTEPATTPTEAPRQPAVVEQLGSVLLVDDRAFDIPYANTTQNLRYAEAVSTIAETLGSGVTTYWMPVPNAAEFHTPAEYHTASTSQKAMFQTCRDAMEGVTYVDAYSVLQEHQEEYIYFRTDHHWTHLGAYYAYTALCRSAGLTPEPLSAFQQDQWDNFVGSLYTYSSNYPQSQVLKDNPDTVYFWRPITECSTNYYSSTALSDPHSIGTISRITEDVSNKYLTFMGGDHPISIVESEAQGPCILVIKESYGNALISWLTSHYSRIIIIDPREYFAINSSIDLTAFAKSQGVTECLIINYPMMLSSEGYISHLEHLAQ